MGKKLSRFNEHFIKSYNEFIDVGYFLNYMQSIQKKLFSSHKDLPFLPERKKLEKVEKLYRRQRKIGHSHKSPKTSTKSWINTKRSAQSN